MSRPPISFDRLTGLLAYVIGVGVVLVLTHTLGSWGG